MSSFAWRFEPSMRAASRVRAERRDPFLAKRVDHAVHQRRLGPDHHQPGTPVAGRGHHPVHVSASTSRHSTLSRAMPALPGAHSTSGLRG